MGNPFDGLLPALAVIAQEARILPATGQAIEDLMRPDHEEVVDRLRSVNDKAMDVVLEAPNRQPYVALNALDRTERHLLRFFLDGSARTFFLGDAVEGRRRTPIHVAQVGAAAVFRRDNGQISVARAVHKVVLMLSKNAVSFGATVEDLVKRAGADFGFHDTLEEDGETEKSSPGREPRSRAAHKAHHIMAGEEERLGRGLRRDHGQWLVLDGSLGKDLHAWKAVPKFFGVTKSFSREPLFKLPGARGGQVVNLYELLANLPFSARTCAFSARSGKVVVWYVRLREQRQLDYPLMGVVKIEFPNPTAEAVPSDLIDELSSAIVAERQVTPHGKDIRWHAHLYAIYLAERAVKTGFVSAETLKMGIRWPTQTGGRLV